ncbi:hypothetical protein EVG20_g9853 [Dentipellis fragilis]|uniref:Uncharacterized protein n=1 Tax=Dentipellis fragilis TaxID=205917 RepID=A0A4Y9XXG4_9AGAM|nr:hypothetical protein EVG20_g9853 [Dentipellis fragilis]
MTSVELTSAVKAVKNLVNKTRQDRALNTEEVAEEETDLQQLEGTLQMLQSKLDAPQSKSYSFSGLTTLSFRPILASLVTALPPARNS